MAKISNSKMGKGVPFQRISDACRTTGLSSFFLRNGCKDGSIPHVMSGNTYYVNVPALLRQLGAVEGTEVVREEN